MHSSSEQHKLVAIMFTDIVGYTAMMSKDEQKALTQVQQQSFFLQQLIEKFDGQLLKEMGDGTLTTFPTASQAARCAQKIQQHAMLKGINLRIGLHVGEVYFNDGDIFGDGVNLASRIESIAMSGGISISEVFCQAIRSKSEFNIFPQGKKKLKGIDDSVNVYALLPEKDIKKKSFLQELKQRNVIKAGVVYLFACGLLTHLLDTSIQLITFTAWSKQSIPLAMLSGFPLIISLFWFFELTPRGLTRQEKIGVMERKMLTNNSLFNIVVMLLIFLFTGLAIYRLLNPILSDNYQVKASVDENKTELRSERNIKKDLLPSVPLKTKMETQLETRLKDKKKNKEQEKEENRIISINKCQPKVLTTFTIKASSDNGNAYSAQRAIDGKLNTGWWAKKDKLKHQWLELTFNESVLIKQVALLNGFPAVWRDNSRVKEIKIIFDDKKIQFIHLKDDILKLQTFMLASHQPTKTVKLLINQVYLGLSYQAPGINELKITGCVVP